MQQDKQEKVRTYARSAATRRVGVGLDDVDIDGNNSLRTLFSIVGDDVSLIQDLESSTVDGYEHVMVSIFRFSAHK